MKRIHAIRLFAAIFLIAVFFTACSRTPESELGSETTTGAGETAVTTTVTSQTDEAEEVARPTGWSEATHSNDADPNYEVVFPEGKVNQITITIDPDSYAAMQADMTELLGEAGTQQGPGGDSPAGALATVHQPDEANTWRLSRRGHPEERSSLGDWVSGECHMVSSMIHVIQDRTP